MSIRTAIPGAMTVGRLAAVALVASASLAQAGAPSDTRAAVDRTVRDAITAAPGGTYSAGKWSAPAGADLVTVLTDWGRAAGYDVVIRDTADWTFAVDYAGRGTFRTVVDEVIDGFRGSAKAPVVVFYSNNVMTIGAR